MHIELYCYTHSGFHVVYFTELPFELPKIHFNKTSAADLTAVDSHSWTVVHHLVQPMEVGTFENLELLCLLHHCGAPLDKLNDKGKSPLQCAVDIGAQCLVDALQMLQIKDKKDWVKIAERALMC